MESSVAPGVEPGAESPPRPELEVREKRPLGKRIYRWTKKIHMYVGLLFYSHLTLYGIAGLVGTFEHAPQDRATPPPTVETVPYRAAAGLTDKEIADELHALIDPALAGPVPEWALRQDDSGNLFFTFHSVSGQTRVTVQEGDGTARVEKVRTPFPRYLSNLHAAVLRYSSADWRTQLWAFMNEAAMWGFLGLTLSGVYLWLATRPGLRLAIASSLGGAAVFILLWVLIR